MDETPEIMGFVWVLQGGRSIPLLSPRIFSDCQCILSHVSVWIENLSVLPGSLSCLVVKPYSFNQGLWNFGVSQPQRCWVLVATSSVFNSSFILLPPNPNRNPNGQPTQTPDFAQEWHSAASDPLGSEAALESLAWRPVSAPESDWWLEGVGMDVAPSSPSSSSSSTSTSTSTSWSHHITSQTLGCSGHPSTVEKWSWLDLFRSHTANLYQLVSWCLLEGC